MPSVSVAAAALPLAPKYPSALSRLAQALDTANQFGSIAMSQGCRLLLEAPGFAVAPRTADWSCAERLLAATCAPVLGVVMGAGLIVASPLVAAFGAVLGATAPAATQPVSPAA